MVASLVNRKPYATGYTPEHIEEILETMDDDDFGVAPEYVDLAKRIAAFNLRHSGKDKVKSKYWFIDGKCVDITKGAKKPRKKLSALTQEDIAIENLLKQAHALAEHEKMPISQRESELKDGELIVGTEDIDKLTKMETEEEKKEYLENLASNLKGKEE